MPIGCMSGYSRLSVAKSARRRRVPLPTLCEIQYGRNKWQKGVYCSSYRVHNFRSLSAPPSDLQQTGFYRPTKSNEPVTVGSRMPGVLNYLHRAKTFGYADLPLSLKLKAESPKADASAGGDGLHKIPANMSKKTRRVTTTKIPVAAHERGPRKEKTTTGHPRAKLQWVAALNMWVQEDKLFKTRHVPMHHVGESRTPTNSASSTPVPSSRRQAGVVGHHMGDISTRMRHDDKYVKFTKPILLQSRAPSHLRRKKKIVYDTYEDAQATRNILKLAVRARKETKEKWMVDHIEIVQKSKSDLVLPKVTGRSGQDDMRTAEVDVPDGLKKRQKGKGFRAGRRISKGKRNALPWSCITVFDSSRAEQTKTHRRLHNRDRRKTSLAFREELEVLRRMFHLPHIALGMDLVLEREESGSDVSNVTDSLITRRRDTGSWKKRGSRGIPRNRSLTDRHRDSVGAKGAMEGCPGSERVMQSTRESESVEQEETYDPHGYSMSDLDAESVHLAKSKCHREAMKRTMTKRRKTLAKPEAQKEVEGLQHVAETGVERQLSTSKQDGRASESTTPLPGRLPRPLTLISSMEELKADSPREKKKYPRYPGVIGESPHDRIDVPPTEEPDEGSDDEAEPLDEMSEKKEQAQGKSRDSRGDNKGLRGEISMKTGRGSYVTDLNEEQRYPGSGSYAYVSTRPRSSSAGAAAAAARKTRRSILPSIVSQLSTVEDVGERGERELNTWDGTPEPTEKKKEEPVSDEERVQRQFESVESIDLRRLSHKLTEEGYNRKEVREKLVKELKRVRAITTRHKKVQPSKKRQSNTDSMPEMEEEYEDFEWIAEFYIMQENQEKVFMAVYDTIDVKKKGWLNSEDTLLALKSVATGITHAEEVYLYRVLELAGYNINDGVDVKLFCIMAALSNKIDRLDGLMKSMLNNQDFRQMENKLYKCKMLWQCFTDSTTQTITPTQLQVVMRMGGLTPAQLAEVQERFKHLPVVTLVDFLLYVPLFTMIHESIIANPLKHATTE